MNRFDKLMQSKVRLKSAWETAFIKNIDLDPTGAVTKNPYTKSALAYSCIKTTATAISQVPLVVQIRKKGKKGKYIWEAVPEDDKWQQLFMHPNMYTDPYTFIESIVSLLLLDGNTWVFPFPPNKKTPDSMWVVRMENMGAEKDKETGHLIGWRYKPDSSKRGILIGPHEVAHIKFYSPTDPIMGQKPLEAGKIPLLSDYKASKYNDLFFDEGATLGGVLSTEKTLGDKQFDRIKAQFEDKHKGYKKSHRTAILEGGLAYTPMGISQKDMEFINLRRYSRDEVLQVFGMKKSILSITDDLNFATSREQARQWWNGTNIPIMRLIQSSINFILFKGKIDQRVIFNTNVVEALQDEYSKKIDQAHKLWQMSYPPNMINEKLNLGLDEIPWGDIGVIPLNLLPVGSNQVLPVEPPKGLSSGETKEVKAVIKVVEEKMDDIEKEMKEEDEARQRRLERCWKNFIAKTDPLETLFESRTKRVFYEMRGEALELLNQKSVADLNAMEYEQYEELLAKYASPIYEVAAKEGWISFVEETGFTGVFDINDPAIAHYLATKPIKIRKVIKTVKKQIIGQVQLGAEAEESVAQIAERIKTVFNMATGRAKDIARTEVVGSSNFGRHAALKGSGFTEKEWFPALDEKMRDAHARMQGKRVKVGEPWIVGGESLDYPGDWNGSAANVINCFVNSRVGIFTDSGWKQIRKIEVGDNVLTHKNRFKKVIRLSPRPKYDGEVVKLIIKNNNEGNILVTPDHPILMGDGNWKIAKKIQKGEKIKVLGGYCSRCGKSIPYWRKYCSRTCLSLDITDKQWSNPKHRENMSKKASVQLKREYDSGVRNKKEITKKARKVCFDKYGKGGYLSKVMKENKEEFLQKGLEGIEKKWGSRLEMLKKTCFVELGKVAWKGSSLEREMKKFLERNGRKYIAQHWVGRRRVDFYLPDEKLFVECDSKAYHGEFENRRENERKRDLEILYQYPDHKIAHVWYGKGAPLWESFDLQSLNHTGTFNQVDVEIGEVKKWKLRKTRRLYNFAVEEDESYIAKGFVVHNCRCIEVVVPEEE